MKAHDYERPAPAPRLKEFADQARQMSLERLRDLDELLPKTRGLGGSTGVFLGLLVALEMLPEGSEVKVRLHQRAVAAAVHVVLDRADRQMVLYDSPAREYWEAFEVVREAALQGRLRNCSSVDDILWEIEERKNEPPPLGECGTIWV